MQGWYCNHYYFCLGMPSLETASFASRFRFAAPVVVAGARLVARLRAPSLGNNGTFAGVHVRRGDKMPLSGPATRSAEQLLLQLAPHLPPPRPQGEALPVVFIASDERRQWFAGWAHRLHVAHASDFASVTAALHGREFLLAALDMFVLLKADKFIMSTGSGLSRRVQLLRDQRTRDRRPQHSVALATAPPTLYRIIDGSTTCPTAAAEQICHSCIWEWEALAFRQQEHRFHNALACGVHLPAVHDANGQP